MNGQGFNWKAGTVFIVYHALLVVTLPFYIIYAPPGAALLIATGIIIAITGVTLTAVYHRYYSHRAYDMNKLAEVVFLFFGTLIAQGSVFEWVFDHRLHHKYTETDRDPHAITRGFWHAHVLWIFHKRPPLDERVIHDLKKSRLLQFQHDHYPLLFTLSSVGTCLFLGWISGDWLGGFYVGFLVRLFISHHCTFCINSLAHYWGSKPFAPEQTAANNVLCSLITWGEGEHNYHHVFPYDYRIGSKLYHWDPGKWMIWTLSKLHLTSNLKRAKPERIEKTRAEATESSHHPASASPS